MMGGGGIQYGLSVQLGGEGLFAFALMFEQAVDRDELLFIHHGFSLSFEDREYTTASDRARCKALGLTFSGPAGWPVLARLRPNFTPADLTPDDAVVMQACLEQACAFAAEIAADGFPAHPGEGRMTARLVDEEGAWQTGSVELPPFDVDFGFDHVAVERAIERVPRSADTWEARLVAVGKIQERGQPGFWGRMLLCVNSQTGMVLPVNVLGPSARVTDALVEVIAKANIIPARIDVTSGLLQRQLAHLAQRLGVELVRVDELPVLEDVASSLTERFG
ncbi:MAG: hypothetical protein AB7O57_23665 [Hyphomicrobiaceae bacterium]